MSDWKDIALDDILDEVNKAAEEGEKQFESAPQDTSTSQDKCGTTIRWVPFCCVTTIPKGFTVQGLTVMSETDSKLSEEEAQDKGISATASVAWHECLNLRLQREEISVNACQGNAPCGSIPACITKVSGCIQFIASAAVNGNGVPDSVPAGTLCPTPNSSNICCKGCVCVDECVRCQLLHNSTPCPNNLGTVTVEVKNPKVCIKDCKPCYCGAPSGPSQVVKFYGKFKITYNPPA